MERTQIYLTEAQTRELDARARARGTTRSHLIREALEQYLGPTWDAEGFIAALRDFQGIWADRDDIDELYADLKQRSRDSLAALWGDRLAEDPAVAAEESRP
ncbi:MAG: CopG family transcriptional regulator [Chloroflexota bacterium]